MAQNIINLFPQHDKYIEPFGGAASVLLRKQPVKHEIYNDLDDNIFNFFKVVRERADELIGAMESTPFSRREFDIAQETKGDELEDARRLLVLSCMGFSSDSATRIGKTGFRSHVDAVTTFLGGFDHLYAVRDRLKNVVLENRPALDVIKQYDSTGALLYVDPPYVLSERNNQSGGYRHELTDNEHEDLAGALETAKSYVVLSGYESELYNDLYSNWEKVTMNVMAQSNRGSVSKQEVLWLSPSISEIDNLPLLLTGQ